MGLLVVRMNGGVLCRWATLSCSYNLEFWAMYISRLIATHYFFPFCLWPTTFVEISFLGGSWIGVCVFVVGWWWW